MKSVLISIRPKWVEKIVNGEKTIEVRKTAPKEVPFKCYIYATKKEYLQHIFKKGEYIFSDDHSIGKFDENIFVKNKHDWQGKVIGEFVCDYVKEYNSNERGWYCYDLETCLLCDEIAGYGKGKTLYGWHISDLKIYDKPKKLSEFKTGCKGCKERDTYHCRFYCYGERPITRPPQSYMFVEEIEE